MKLTDRVAIVTGAAGGIGGAIARRFACEGASLSLVDLQPPTQLASEVQSSVVRTIELGADVSDHRQIRDLVEKTLKAFGQIDILINAAGVASFGSAQALAESEWDRVLNVN